MELVNAGSLKEVADRFYASLYRVRKWKALGCPELAEPPYCILRIIGWLTKNLDWKEIEGQIGFESWTNSVLGVVAELESREVAESRPIQNGESVVATVDYPKTAALFFDRVWSPVLECPTGIAVFRGSEIERFAVASHFKVDHFTRMLLSTQSKHPSDDLLNLIRSTYDKHNFVLRSSASQIGEEIGSSVSPVYSGPGSGGVDVYKEGAIHMLTASLNNMKVVNEKALTWEQVSEIRMDKESRKRLQNLVHWLDEKMIGKSRQFIEDEISIKIDQYKDAIRKHGIGTVTGTLSTLLDPKTLGGAVIAGAGLSASFEAMVGLFVGVSVLGAKAAIEVTKHAMKANELKSDSP